LLSHITVHILLTLTKFNVPSFFLLLHYSYAAKSEQSGDPHTSHNIELPNTFGAGPSGNVGYDFPNFNQNQSGYD